MKQVTECGLKYSNQQGQYDIWGSSRAVVHTMITNQCVDHVIYHSCAVSARVVANSEIHVPGRGCTMAALSGSRVTSRRFSQLIKRVFALLSWLFSFPLQLHYYSSFNLVRGFAQRR